MNINGLGSVSWYTSLRSISNASSSSGGSQSSGLDSASISSEGFAALLQQQGGGGGPPEITDAMAGKVGTALQEKSPALFQALDSDQDGTLSASELKTGMDALRGDQGQRPPPPPPSGGGKPPEMTDAAAASIGTQMQQQNQQLFSALDTNQDGTLSADELQAGNESMHQAMESGGMQPPPPPGGAENTGSDASSSGSTWSDYQANLMTSILQSLFANSSTSST